MRCDTNNLALKLETNPDDIVATMPSDIAELPTPSAPDVSSVDASSPAGASGVDIAGLGTPLKPRVSRDLDDEDMDATTESYKPVARRTEASFAKQQSDEASSAAATTANLFKDFTGPTSQTKPSFHVLALRSELMQRLPPYVSITSPRTGQRDVSTTKKKKRPSDVPLPEVAAPARGKAEAPGTGA